MLTDYQGSKVTQVYYKPYGETYDLIGEDIFRYKFTAQEEDNTTGLYYYNTRFYDPAIGRFTSPDTMLPITEMVSTQGLNRYMYVKGNPIKYNDPTGHEGECWTDESMNEINDIIWEGSTDNSTGGSVDNSADNYSHYQDYQQPASYPTQSVIPPQPPSTSTYTPPTTIWNAMEQDILTPEQNDAGFYYIYIEAPSDIESGSPWNPAGHAAVLEVSKGKYTFYELAQGTQNKGEYKKRSLDEFLQAYPNRNLYRAPVNVPNPKGLRAAVRTGGADYNLITNNCKHYAFSLFAAGGVSKAELYRRSYGSSTAIITAIGVSITLTPATAIPLFLWGAPIAPSAFSGLEPWTP